MNRRILGIDYGSKRIGIAVSDPLNVIARGVRTVQNSERAFKEIAQVALEFDVECIVVGMPLTLKGEKGQKAEEVEKFIEKLQQELQLPVVRYDERFTSHTAHETLRILGVPKKQRQSKERIDEMASALILQGYLDSRRS